MSQDHVWQKIKEIGIIPTVRTLDPKKGVLAAQAVLAGGIPIVEVSLCSPGAIHTLEAVLKGVSSHMIVGAGSVLLPETLSQAVAVGAQFIVTPGLGLEMLELARKLEVLILPGGLTPTEVQNAYAHGARIVKLFPCDFVGGPHHVKALRMEYPEVEFIASGGIHFETCSEYFHAGAAAIGVGAAIADSRSIEKGLHKLFTERSRRFVETVKMAQDRWALSQTK
ncbi:MAG: bifunctional 4-hydroxy-2-oxoglutarate aldolase/2-dehydro-3-deoxy-phosphogluconate aldolase [Bryobacteraceae bacterium]